MLLVFSTMLFWVFEEARGQFEGCSDITDCFNCSFAIPRGTGCKWKNSACEASNSTDSFPNWFEKFSECERDNFSAEEIKSNCNQINQSDSSIKVSLQQEGYAKTNLYCMWTLQNLKPTETIEIFLNKSFESEISKDDYSIEIYQDESNETILFDPESDFYTSSTSTSRIVFRYFSRNGKKESPFMFLIKYKKKGGLMLSTKIVLAVLGVVMFVCILFVIIFCCWSKMAKKDMNTENHPTMVTVRTTETEETAINFSKIYSYPILLYENGMKNYNDLCTICLEKFTIGDKIIRLLCGHAFHSNCIFKWFKKKDDNKCPNCNKEIVEYHQILINPRKVPVKSKSKAKGVRRPTFVN